MEKQTIIEKNIFNGTIFENITLTYIEEVFRDLNKQNEAEIENVKNNIRLTGLEKANIKRIFESKIEANKAALKKYKSSMVLSKALINVNKEVDMKSFIENMKNFYADLTMLVFDKVPDYREIRNENIIPALAQKVESFESGCVKIGEQYYKITI
jgi:Glu-tRNA(Gln) amidotransferase subunit E-like FAD-binding protein